jgi:hypothetical protein
LVLSVSSLCFSCVLTEMAENITQLDYACEVRNYSSEV